MKKVRQGVDQNLLTDQWKEIIEDDEIQIVIEVMGGIEPAKTMITEALKAGKNVVSANKDLIAEYGKELYDAAKEGGADFLFEAAVAGGIPIIRPLKQCLEGNRIDEIMGIVNGTTNYILTKMFEDAGLSKDDEIVTYCTGGIRSAYTQLVMEMCGFEHTYNYDQSFWRWAVVGDVE